MATSRSRSAKRARAREPLTHAHALDVAIELADAGGLAELSMRRLAAALGVEAMSLYHHVPNKSAILDGMVDRVFAEIERPASDAPWKPALRARMISVRAALLRHRWALAILETRTAPGPETLAHHDAVLGCLYAGGFSVAEAGHAFSVLDSYVFGFVHTELALPFRTTDDAHSVVTSMMEAFPDGAYPHLATFAREQVFQPDYSYANEFPFGLDLILDGLERRLAESRPPTAPVRRGRASARR